MPFLLLLVVLCACEPDRGETPVAGSDAWVPDPRVAREAIEPGADARAGFEPEDTLGNRRAIWGWFRDAGALEKVPLGARSGPPPAEPGP